VIGYPIGDLRVNLNHPSHSKTSRLLTSSGSSVRSGIFGPTQQTKNVYQRLGDQESSLFEVCLSTTHSSTSPVYYESIKREVKRRLIYEYRCHERLKTKTEESTHLGDTGLVVELEHLKMKTRLIDEKFASVRGDGCCPHGVTDLRTVSLQNSYIVNVSCLPHSQMIS
jgi:hypothetical protein